MDIWILIIWAGSSLLACWSFSLFVRLISELFARRRKRLVSQRSRRSVWIGFALIFICAAASIVLAIGAIRMGKTYEDQAGFFSTPFGTVGASMGLFGLFMIVGAAIGDRARGRIRCPKCWYDMSAAAGLQCPECGRTAKSAKQFHRSRRRKWAFVVGFGMLSLGGYGVSVNKRVAESDWLAAVPSWFLMAGWEWLPEDWIIEENSWYEATLEDRLESTWSVSASISPSRFRRFEKKLCKPMLSDQSARWNHRRLYLVNSMYYTSRYYAMDNNGDLTIWTDAPLDEDELLFLALEDMLDALLTDTPTPGEKLVLNAPTACETSFWIAAKWILDREEHAGRIDYEEQDTQIVIKKCTDSLFSAIEPLRPRLLSDEFGLTLISNDKQIRRLSFEIQSELNLFEDHLEINSSTNHDPAFVSPYRRLRRTAFHSRYFSDESISTIIEKLTEFITSNDSVNIAIATDVLYALQLFGKLDDSLPNQEYIQLIELVKQHALHDNRTVDYGGNQSESLHSLAVNVLVLHDSSGSTSFPLIRDTLLSTGTAPNISRRRGFLKQDDLRDSQLWFDYFGDLANSPVLTVRQWVIDNLPKRIGTPQDEVLNKIALDMLSSEDEDIRWSAINAIIDRKAEHLLPDETNP